MLSINYRVGIACTSNRSVDRLEGKEGRAQTDTSGVRRPQQRGAAGCVRMGAVIVAYAFMRDCASYVRGWGREAFSWRGLTSNEFCFTGCFNFLLNNGNCLRFRFAVLIYIHIYVFPNIEEKIGWKDCKSFSTRKSRSVVMSKEVLLAYYELSNIERR